MTSPLKTTSTETGKKNDALVKMPLVIPNTQLYPGITSQIQSIKLSQQPANPFLDGKGQPFRNNDRNTNCHQLPPNESELILAQKKPILEPDHYNRHVIRN